MKLQLITSSYPAYPDDPSGTAGLFVRQFAISLMEQGHQVVIHPVARKGDYDADAGLIIEPLPWKGGDRELASMPLSNPAFWPVYANFFRQGIQTVMESNQRHQFDRTLCFWAVPAGIFGNRLRSTAGVPYDVWALGSDIWKIRKIPWLGNALLKRILRNADRLYADGLQLADDVQEIGGRPCEFLPSSRKLPTASGLSSTNSKRDGKRKLLFVGRYHPNKGPDLLLESIAKLEPESRNRIHLKMFGLGPMEEALRQSRTGWGLEDSVELNGPIQAQSFADELAQCDYLVIPSRIESIPVVFSDAIQTGTPVISMPVGDLTEIVRESRCGLLADNVDATSLSKAISMAISQSPDTFAKGVSKTAEKFNIDQAARNWIETIGKPQD